jgi:hypothetical protein
MKTTTLFVLIAIGALLIASVAGAGRRDRACETRKNRYRNLIDTVVGGYWHTQDATYSDAYSLGYNASTFTAAITELVTDWMTPDATFVFQSPQLNVTGVGAADLIFKYGLLRAFNRGEKRVDNAPLIYCTDDDLVFGVKRDVLALGMPGLIPAPAPQTISLIPSTVDLLIKIDRNDDIAFIHGIYVQSNVPLVVGEYPAGFKWAPITIEFPQSA